MSISGVNGGVLAPLFHQRRLDFKTLASAIEAGDTNAAQAALQSYQNDIASIDAAGGSGDQSGSGAQNGAGDQAGSNPLAAKIKTDFSVLATAVQSGNITDAQAALKTYQQDRQSLRQGNSGQSSSDLSSLVKDLISLITSIQSGDQNATQTNAQALTRDLQSLSQSGGSQKTHGHHHHHHHNQDAPSSSDATNGASDPSASTLASTGASSGGQTLSISFVVKQFTALLTDTPQTTTQAVL